jgi:hypothetical protein
MSLALVEGSTIQMLVETIFVQKKRLFSIQQSIDDQYFEGWHGDSRLLPVRPSSSKAPRMRSAPFGLVFGEIVAIGTALGIVCAVLQWFIRKRVVASSIIDKRLLRDRTGHE